MPPYLVNLLPHKVFSFCGFFRDSQKWSRKIQFHKLTVEYVAIVKRYKLGRNRSH